MKPLSVERAVFFVLSFFKVFPVLNLLKKFGYGRN
jgi:hypothetical protein